MLANQLIQKQDNAKKIVNAKNKSFLHFRFLRL